MANYVSLDNLRLYDTKIKAVISTGDATAEAKAVSEAAKVQTNLDTEVARAKAAEEANAAAAKKAQDEVDALELVVDTKAADADLTALAGKVGNVPEGSTVMGIITNIQENAYDDTDVRALISGLDTKKADKTQVATDIAAAVKVETDARVEAVAGVQSAVDTLSGTHATDKKALEDAIALKADASKVDEMDETLAAVKEDVDAFFADADMAESAKDTLKELQEYIASDETGASAMAASIKTNSDDIDALEGKMTTAEGKITTLEGEMDAVESAVATKVEQSAYNEKIAALEGADTTLSGKVTALEGKFGEGEGTVGDMISDAIATEGARVDGELAKKIETVKVNGVAMTMDANKAVDIAVPTDNNQLTNGAGYLVASDIANKADKADSLSGYGITNAYTKTETDTAISNAVAAIQPIATSDIENLFA